MKVAFGISVGSSTPLLRREDTRKFMDLVKMADDYGAEAIGTFDTAFIGGDAYVRATLIAQASDVEIWFTARSSLHEDRDTAIDNVKASVSSILNHSMRFGLEGKHVPEDLRAKIEAYLDHYVLYDHVLHEGQNPKRMEALGLTPYALERFALAGNARDWIERIEQVAALGATRLWIGVSGHDLDTQAHYLGILGSQIMPRFIA